ncbi:MAG: cytidine deaminase [Flavobacteriaceae bacterium]|nr:cytidine deaminase [Flavobacteriaceae bacterium]
MPKQQHIGFSYSIYTSLDELAPEDQTLVLKARKARKNAYAPYSNFQVGAALLLNNNKVVLGANQENASFPSGLCAERVAVYAAGANFPEAELQKVAICAAPIDKKSMTPAAPCGACRQALLEYELKQDKNIQVFLTGSHGEVWKLNSIKDLMPLIFDPKLLNS